ncbi:MAG: DUF5615 family PIN-like protein [Armatimonadota bacterium]|nr:DUF5615 family PIN-like protein [Armatimonadota bacterium]
MRWLADENVETGVVEALRSLGHDVEWVSETASGAEDEDVIAAARAGKRLILTNAKDFGELVFRLGLAAAGIVLLRVSTRDADEKGRHLRRVLPAITDRLRGSFTVVTDDGVRVRALDHR